MAFFKKAKKYDAGEATEKQQQRADEVGEKKFAPRVTLKEGLNAFLWLPSIDSSNMEPLRHVYLHYGPKHICGRPDSQMDPKTKKVKDDRNFRNCFRCITAWTRFEDTVDIDDRKDKTFRSPDKDKWKDDSGKQKSLLQVVNLTPFFKPDSSGSLVKPDPSLIKDHFDNFLAVLAGGDVPEGMPDDIAEAAQAGPSIIDVNRPVGLAIMNELLKRIAEEEGDDPLCEPDRFVFQISKEVDTNGKQWQTRDGKAGKSFLYTPGFSPFKKKPWIAKKKVEELVAAIEPLMQNLHDPQPVLTDDMDEEAILLARGRCLERLNDTDLEAFLTAGKHSFDVREKKQNSEAGLESEEQTRKVDMMRNPDAFESTTTVMGIDDAADLESLRADLEDDEDE